MYFKISFHLIYWPLLGNQNLFLMAHCCRKPAALQSGLIVNFLWSRDAKWYGVKIDNYKYPFIKNIRIYLKNDIDGYCWISLDSSSNSQSYNFLSIYWPKYLRLNYWIILYYIELNCIKNGQCNYAILPLYNFKRQFGPYFRSVSTSAFNSWQLMVHYLDPKAINRSGLWKLSAMR